MAGLHFIITADNSSFIKAMSQTKEKIKEVSMQVEKEGGNIDNLISRIAKGAAAIGLGFSATQLINDIVNVRGEFQKLSVAFETMLGSKEKADSLMKQMVETAATTPFGLQDVAGGAKQLLAYGVSAEDVNETLIRLGDIAAGLSIPLGDLVYLYGTTRAQGRLYTEDFNQFTSRGIPMIEMLAEKFGVAENEVKGLVEAGKVGFPEVQEVIENLTNEGGKFGGLMEAQSKTISGQISNIEDAFETMFNEIGKQNEGVINTALSSVSYLVEHYDKVGKSITAIAATYGTYRTALVLAKVAQDTLTARMQLSVVVAKAQTVALKALNSVMKANPYVFVATAIIGVVTAMWALHDSTTAAERAQVKFNESQKRTTEREDERRRKIEELIRTIQDETETEYSKIKAYEEIQKYSPALVSAYNREELATLSLADAQKSLNKERDKAIYQNILSNIEKYTRYVNVLQNAKSWNDLGELRSDIKSEYGIGLLSGKAEQAEVDLSKWQSALDEYKKLKKEAENESKPVNVRLFEANSDLKQIESEFEKARKKLEEEQNKLSENPYHVIPFYIQIEFDNAKGKLDNQKFKVTTLESELNTGRPYREAYDEAKTAYEARLRAVKDARKGTEAEYLKAVVELEEAEKRYKALGGITGSSLIKQENQAKKDAERQIKEQQELAEELLKIRFKNQQDEINLLEDGRDKKRRQLELDYQMEVDEIHKLEKKWSEKNGGALTMEQSVEISRRYAYAEAKYDKGVSDITSEDVKKLQSMLEKYQDYAAQRKSIEKQMNEDIAFLQSQRTEANSDEIDRAIKVAKDKAKEAVQAVMDEENKALAGQDNTFLKMLFGDVSQMAFSDLSDLIAQARQLRDYLSGNGDKNGITFISTEQLKAIEESPEELDKLKKALDKLLDSGKKSHLEEIFDTFRKGFADLQSAKGFKDISGAIGTISGAAGDAAGMISEMFDAMGNTAVADALGGVQQVMNAVSNIGQGFAKGGIVGGIAAAIGEAANFIGQAFSANQRHKEALKQVMNEAIAQQREYNLLLMQQNLLYEEATTIFGTDAYSKAANSVNVMKDAISELNEALKGTSEQQEKQNTKPILGRMMNGVTGYYSELKSLYAGLADVDIKTGHKKTGLFGWGKGKDIYSSILDVYPDLIDANGDFNKELAETIINTREMSDEDKAALQNMIDLAEQAEEAYEALNDYMTDIFGELGGSMSDALVDAFKNGTDAASAFADSVSDMLETLAEQMVYSVTLAPIMEEAQSAMLDVMNDTSLTDKQKYAQWTNILNGLVSDATEQQQIANSLYEAYQQAAKEQGFDIFKPESSSQQSASGKGFETMSQDSADELNGRFTALYESNLRIEGATEEQTAVLKNIFETISTSLTSPFGDTGFIQSVTDTTTDSMDAMIRESMSRIADGIIGIPSLVAEGNMSLVELVNISMSSNSYLEDITIWQKKTNTLLSNMLKSIDERLKRI